MAGPVWGWDRASQRYRDLDTGRYMPRQQVLDYVVELITGRKVVTDRLAAFAAEGSLSPKDFGETLKGELKRQYINEYMLGRGGREQMTKRDWGSIGGMLKEQYKYLPGFVDAIATSEMTADQIAMRAGMYVNSSREAYSRAHGRNAEDLGMAYEQWFLDGGEHCDGCVALAAEGKVPIGTLGTVPGAGDTQCLTACLCSLIYSDESGNKY